MVGTVKQCRNKSSGKGRLLNAYIFTAEVKLYKMCYTNFIHATNTNNLDTYIRIIQSNFKIFLEKLFEKIQVKFWDRVKISFQRCLFVYCY